MTARNLDIDFKVKLETEYINTSDTINPSKRLDSLDYNEVFKSFNNGVSSNQANVQYYKRDTVDGVNTIDLNDLENRWGDLVTVESVKVGAIFNRDAVSILVVQYKDERYRIGPGGFRVFYDPLDGVASSGETDNVLTTSGSAITYDIILLGAGQDFAAGAAMWIDAGSQVFSGGSRQFTRAQSEYFTIVDNTSLSTGDIDFTIAAWAYLDTAASTEKGIIGKWSAVGNQRGFNLEYGSSDRFLFQVSADGTGLSGSIAANTFGAPPMEQWCFVVAEHDSVADTMSIQVNDGTIDSSSYSSGVFDETADFQIGAFQNSGAYMDGRLARCCFWKRTLTTSERSFLYNSGLGRGYRELGEIGNGSDLKTSLISYWDLNEPSGNAIDRHSSNTLTDNNTVTSEAGPATTARSDFTAGFLKYDAVATVTIPSLSFYTNDFSISTWVRLVAAGDEINIFNEGSYVSLSINSLGNIVLDLNDGTISETITTVSTPIGTSWSHIVIAIDRTNNTVDFYHNGTFLEQSAITIIDSLLPSSWRVGNNVVESSADEGIMGPTGIWTKKKISLGEASLLYNEGNPVHFNSLPSSLDNPAEYWNMDEASGDATSSRSQVITKTRDPSVGATNYFFSSPSPFALSPNSSSFTIAGWINLTDFVGTDRMDVLAYFELSLDQFFISFSRDGDEKITFTIHDGTASHTVKEDLVLFGVMYIICDYNVSTSTMSIQIDENDKVSGDGGTIDGTQTFPSFILGAGPLGANSLAAPLAQWAYWHRVLTDAEKAFLYNKGRGRLYTDLGVVDTDGSSLLTNLTAYWALDEASGTALDSHNSNNLPENAAVASGSVGVPAGDLAEQTTVGSSAGPGRSLSPASDGDSIESVQDKISLQFFEQADRAKQPVYELSSINGKPGMTFDGSNDLLVFAGSLLNGTLGTVVAVYELTASLLDFQAILSVADEDANDGYVAMRAYHDVTTEGPMVQFSAEGGAYINKVSGSTLVVAGISYIAVWQSSGVAYSVRLNGNDEVEEVTSGSNNGDWWGDNTTGDNVVIGGRKSTSENQFLKGTLSEIIVYDGEALTPTQISQVESSLALKYGITLP